MGAQPDMTEKPFHESFDARDWAKAFVATAQTQPEIATDEATMVSWFANAIMRGYDDARAKYDPNASGLRASSGLPNAV